MISLFIDTSSSDVSIAIVKDNKILSNINKNIPNEHSIYTTSFLDKALNEAKITSDDIDKIMVVNGPGSFTGVRIGVTIAKVFSYLKKIDIVCISSLKMRAISIKHDNCLVLLDAKHDNYYIGLYDKDNNEIIKEQFNNKTKIIELIKKYNPICISDKNLLIDEIKVQKSNLDIKKIVSYYINSKPLNCHLVVPNYLKLPQALEQQK